VGWLNRADPAEFLKEAGAMGGKGAGELASRMKVHQAGNRKAAGEGEKI
jgi:hypothetical protein